MKTLSGSDQTAAVATSTLISVALTRPTVSIRGSFQQLLPGFDTADRERISYGILRLELYRKLVRWMREILMM